MTVISRRKKGRADSQQACRLGITIFRHAAVFRFIEGFIPAGEQVVGIGVYD